MVRPVVRKTPVGDESPTVEIRSSVEGPVVVLRVVAFGREASVGRESVVRKQSGFAPVPSGNGCERRATGAEPTLWNEKVDRLRHSRNPNASPGNEYGYLVGRYERRGRQRSERVGQIGIRFVERQVRQKTGGKAHAIARARRFDRYDLTLYEASVDENVVGASADDRFGFVRLQVGDRNVVPEERFEGCGVECRVERGRGVSRKRRSVDRNGVVGMKRCREYGRKGENDCSQSARCHCAVFHRRGVLGRPSSSSNRASTKAGDAGASNS